MQNVKSQSRYALFLLRESVLEVLSKYPNKRLSLGEIRQRIGLPVLREDNIKSNKLTHGVIDYLLEDGLVDHVKYEGYRLTAKGIEAVAIE